MIWAKTAHLFEVEVARVKRELAVSRMGRDILLTM